MRCELLSALPTSLVAVILAEYVCIEDVTWLDSACCSITSRRALFDVYQDPGFVVLPPSDFYQGEYVSEPINWFVQRRIKVSKVCIADGMNMSRLSDLLEIVGPVLKGVAFMLCWQPEQMTTALDVLQPYTTHLERVGFVECTLPSDLSVFFAGMRNMKRIVISVAGQESIPADLFAGMICPDFDSLMLNGGPDWHWDETFAQLFLPIGSTLRGLYLCGMDLSDACTNAIARLCPNLKILHLMIESVYVGAFCEHCTELEHVDMFTATDACVEKIARCPKLRTLSVMGALKLTSTAMVAIGAHLSSTLTSLTLLEVRVSSADLASVIDKLPHLTYLEFGGQSDNFISHLSKIETLSIVSGKAPRQQKLVASVARHCTALVHFRLDSSKQLTPALTALVKKCRTLRTLHLQAVNLTKIEEWRKIYRKAMHWSAPLAGFALLETLNDLLSVCFTLYGYHMQYIVIMRFVRTIALIALPHCLKLYHVPLIIPYEKHNKHL